MNLCLSGINAIPRCVNINDSLVFFVQEANYSRTVYLSIEVIVDIFFNFFFQLNNQQQNFYFSIQLLWEALELVKLTVLRIIYDMFTEGFSCQSVGGKWGGWGVGEENETYCWGKTQYLNVLVN